jgi:hypothetical protein
MGDVGDGRVQLEISMGSGPSCMNDAFGDALMIEVMNFLSGMRIFKQSWALSQSLEGVHMLGGLKRTRTPAFKAVSVSCSSDGQFRRFYIFYMAHTSCRTPHCVAIPLSFV